MAKLTRDGSALAQTIHNMVDWKQVVAHITRVTRFTFDDLRLVRLMKDNVLEQRFRSVLDDRFKQLSVELYALLLPNDESVIDDTALLKAR